MGIGRVALLGIPNELVDSPDLCGHTVVGSLVVKDLIGPVPFMVSKLVWMESGTTNCVDMEPPTLTTRTRRL